VNNTRLLVEVWWGFVMLANENGIATLLYNWPWKSFGWVDYKRYFKVYGWKKSLFNFQDSC
jgi:hypothetical protein